MIEERGKPSGDLKTMEEPTNKSENEKDPSAYIKQAVDLLAETTNQVLDTVSWVAGKLHSSGNTFKIAEAKGHTAEVSLSIPPGGTGEIVVVLKDTRKHYPARAVTGEMELKRGSKVIIKDIAVSTMFVEAAPETLD